MRRRIAEEMDRVVNFDLLKRFMEKIEVEAVTNCWLWTASKDSKRGNYPRLWFEGRNMRAHKLSYLMFVGPIDRGLTIHHTCHCPECVNPAHLELATESENSRERWDRSRIT